MLLPTLVVAFSVAVATTRRRHQFEVTTGLQVGLHTAFPVYVALAVLLVGVGLVTLNLSLPNVYEGASHSGGCIDPLIHTTITVVETHDVDTFQWLWVVLVALENVAFGIMHHHIEEDCPRKAARATQRCLRSLASQVGRNSQQEQAIAVWRSKSIPTNRSVAGLLHLAQILLHIPVITLAMAPACAFVSEKVVRQE